MSSFDLTINSTLLTPLTSHMGRALDAYGRRSRRAKNVNTNISWYAFSILFCSCYAIVNIVEKSFILASSCPISIACGISTYVLFP